MISTAEETRADRMIQICICAFFLSLFLSRSGIAATSALCLLVGTYVYRGALKEHWRQIPQLVPLTAFFISIGISVVGAEPYSWDGPIGKLRYWLLYIPLLLAFAATPRLIERCCRLGVGLAILLGTVSVLQYFGVWQYSSGWIPQPTNNLIFLNRFHARGFLPHHTIFSSVCLFLFHLMFSAWISARRSGSASWSYALGVVFSSAAILATYSRGAWFAWIASAVLSAAFGMGRQSIKWIVGLGVTVALLLTASPVFRTRFTQLGADQNSERLTLWKVSGRMFQESPIIGKGFHSFATHLDRLLTPEEKAKFPGIPRDAHSIYLDLLGGTGVLGLCTFLWLMGSCLLSYLRISPHSLSPPDFTAISVGFGTLVAALINNLSDTHLVGTYGLSGAVFFLAMGQSLVYRHQSVPEGSVSAFTALRRLRSANAP